MSEATQADRYLIEQIREGSPDGWAQLVNRYQGRLLAFAQSKLRGRGDAEDLVQETFISFLKALNAFREEASLETYLFTILRHKIIDACRGRKVNVCLLQDVLSDEGLEAGDATQAISADDPSASWYARRDEEHGRHRRLLAAGLRELIHGYKQSLNFRDLQIVEMLFYGQFRNMDVAEVVGVDEKHVAVIKHRCLRRMQDAVQVEAGRFDFEPDPAMLTQVWQEQRLSCPKRSTIGAFLLGTLEPDWHNYVGFHIDRLGCQFCRANLEDLREQTAAATQESFRQRIMQSTVGFLHKN